MIPQANVKEMSFARASLINALATERMGSHAPQLAQVTVANALKAAKSTKPKLVQVGGHADTTGDVVYNALSQRRATAVSKVLKAGGLTKKKLVRTAMFGEDFTAISTGDEVNIRGNRRVEIKLKY